jgi:hypothetical protein
MELIKDISKIHYYVKVNITIHYLNYYLLLKIFIHTMFRYTLDFKNNLILYEENISKVIMKSNISRSEIQESFYKF